MSKKLRLQREVLSELTGAELMQVVGGGYSEAHSCGGWESCTCPESYQCPMTYKCVVLSLGC